MFYLAKVQNHLITSTKLTINPYSRSAFCIMVNRGYRPLCLPFKLLNVTQNYFALFLLSGGLDLEAGDRLRPDAGGQPDGRSDQKKRRATFGSKFGAKFSRRRVDIIYGLSLDSFSIFLFFQHLTANKNLCRGQDPNHGPLVL